MGCFNVVCGISKLSIGAEDPVVFIPLRLNPYREESDISATKAYPFLVHPWDIYVPITLPLIGKYNEYGGIHEIVRDENVEFIEQHFGMTIEEFVDLDKQPEIIDSGMFIHKEIYDHFIVDNKEREFFSKQYDRKRELIVLERKLQDAYFNIAFEEKADKEVRLKAMSAWMDVKEERNSFSAQEATFGGFYRLYEKVIEEGKAKELFIDFKMLGLAMMSTNSHYSPAMSGYQHGDDAANQELYRIAHQIIEQRLCEYGGIDESEIEDEAFFYTYRVAWSSEDCGFIATCDEFPSLSWISNGPENALFGLRKIISDCIKDMIANKEVVPVRKRRNAG